MGAASLSLLFTLSPLPDIHEQERHCPVAFRLPDGKTRFVRRIFRRLYLAALAQKEHKFVSFLHTP